MIDLSTSKVFCTVSRTNAYDNELVVWKSYVTLHPETRTYSTANIPKKYTGYGFCWDYCLEENNGNITILSSGKFPKPVTFKLLPIDLPIKTDPPKFELLTGQVWYERFTNEYKPWQRFITKDYNDGYADARMKAIEAAKKASGIE